MVLEIEIPLRSITDIFETHSITTGMSKDVPGGANIQLRPPPVPMEEPTLAYDADPFFTIAVTVASTVGLNIFSSWLYDRLKDSKVRRIRINRRTAEVTPDGLREAVEELIETEER